MRVCGKEWGCVLEKERQSIAAARDALKQFEGFPASENAPAAKDPDPSKIGDSELTGETALCLSGGGIRSAIFALGALQALAGARLLRQFDYLSTVSGGGYIGTWLTAMIHWRSKKKAGTGRRDVIAALDGIEKELGDSLKDMAKEPHELRFLREYANYLCPARGALSGDGLSMIAIYVRNLLVNWLVIVPLFAAILLLPRMLEIVVSVGPVLRWTSPWIMVSAAAAAILLAMFLPTRKTIAPTEPDKPGTEHPKESGVKKSERGMEDGWLDGFGPVAFVVSILAYIASLAILGPPVAGSGVWGTLLAFVGLGIVLSQLFDESGPDFVCALRAAFLVLLPALLMTAGVASCVPESWSGNSAFWVCTGLPFLTAVFLASVSMLVGLTDRLGRDDDREWWARAGGWIGFFAAVWLLISSISLGIPRLLEGIPEAVAPFADQFRGTSLAILIGLATALLRTRESGKCKWLFPVLAGAFLLGFFGWLAWLVDAWVRIDPAGTGSNLRVLHAFAACIGAWLLFGLSIDVNKFSAHAAYRNRLTRTFLGAAQRQRKRNAFTGFSLSDHIRLHEIAQEQRPFHVICAVVNLFHGVRLATQERRSESFTFSPLHCGCDETNATSGQAGPSPQLGYRDSREYGGPKGLQLASAMAISGAAANPASGYYSEPLRAFVMTLLNARLGWWAGNPNNPHTSRKRGPRCAGKELLFEAFGLLSPKHPYVHLSDGGHFDNTAVYEMLRRRCRFIVLIDAECDYKGLARLIRNAWVDFGCKIDMLGLPQEPLDGRTAPPANIGLIRYGEQHPNGILLRVQPTRNGVAAADLVEYGHTHATFPNDPLADQFFEESQFESYRKLGAWAIQRLVPVTSRTPCALSDIATAVLEKTKAPSDKIDAGHGTLSDEIVDALKQLRGDSGVPFAPVPSVQSAV